jgi:tryptophan synthase alpha chain
MSRIKTRFEALAADKKKALIIFLTVGDPSVESTIDLVCAAFDNGADIVELGIPFSDPLADGPVIQDSFLRAIEKGVNLDQAFADVEAIRLRETEKPLVFMLASTLIINYGTNKFMRRAAAAGVDGIIVPDAPVDEAAEFSLPAKAVGLDSILLAAPTSTPARVKRIAKASSGFIYYINVTGVTGGKKPSAAATGKGIAAIKKVTKLPVCAGFGISTPEDARAMGRHADGIIIGSQAIREMRATRSSAEAVQRIGEYVASIRRGLDGQ